MVQAMVTSYNTLVINSMMTPRRKELDKKAKVKVRGSWHAHIGNLRTGSPYV